MWIFGYGSLMWRLEDLEEYVKSRNIAEMIGIHRDFNKSSTLNWGTKNNPAPTLGLKRGGNCVGMIFEFDDKDKDTVMNYLKKREGAHFIFPKKKIQVEGVGEVEAFYPYNKRDDTFIGRKSIKKRAKMCLKASGTKGSCVDYVNGTRNKLNELNIDDKFVEECWNEIEKLRN